MAINSVKQLTKLTKKARLDKECEEAQLEDIAYSIARKLLTRCYREVLQGFKEKAKEGRRTAETKSIFCLARLYENDELCKCPLVTSMNARRRLETQVYRFLFDGLVDKLKKDGFTNPGVTNTGYLHSVSDLSIRAWWPEE